MAGRGPAPKESHARARDDARRSEKVELTADGDIHGPELPGDAGEWPEATLSWWETWRRSAQAATFTETDWDFLLDTALLHRTYWQGSLTLAGELRLRVAKFGATPEDRARLRIAVEPAKDEPTRPAAKKPTSQARRDRVLKVVEAG